MTGREVAQDTVDHFARMFDLSLTRGKMMGMMPGSCSTWREPEKVQPALEIMLPMMKDMGIEVNDDLLIEMMPSVAKAVDRAPSLGARCSSGGCG